MIRRTPLKRSTKPIPRKRKGGPRRSVFRCRPYLKWLHGERCQIHGNCSASIMNGCDPCHYKPNGKGSKGPDDQAISMCHSLHLEQTAIGWDAFEAKYRIDRAAIAKAQYAKYLEEKR